MGIAYKGVNYAGIVKSPLEMVEQGQFGGRPKVMYDEFVLTADLAAGDSILVGAPLPEGAVLQDCWVTTGALGGACTINVGWQAGASGVEAAVPTGFFSALPVSSATVAKAHGSTYEGSFYRKKLAEQVQPVIAENAVSSGATGIKVQIEIHYIVD